MRFYHFTEQPYPDAWLPDAKSLRVTLPNALCDPEVASNLMNRYLDEWVLADELGLDIMVNEHHSTATCLSPSVNLVLGILARITKSARLVALGVPLANRLDPLRVAEELSVIDVLSKGRLDMGFVKGVPYEVAPANSNPVRMMDRLWEAHDLILKAMATHDGPFNWEGEYFQYRSVNIWPRPYQDPHPPVWITSLSPGSVRAVAERGYVLATVLTGVGAKALYDIYREVWAETHSSPPNIDRFAYLGLCAVANNETAALQRAYKVAGYLRTTAVVAKPFSAPPGYMAPAVVAKQMKNPGAGGHYFVKCRSGKVIEATTASNEELIEGGLMFAGTPDQVYQQIVEFCDEVGGLGHLMLMLQGGDLNAAETTDSITLFCKEVLPRLREHFGVDATAAA